MPAYLIQTEGNSYHFVYGVIADSPSAAQDKVVDQLSENELIIDCEEIKDSQGDNPLTFISIEKEIDGFEEDLFEELNFSRPRHLYKT